MTERTRIDIGRLRADIDGLARIGVDPTGGISRPAWSPAHEEARGFLLDRLRAAGLAARVDPAGNVVGRLGDPEAPAPVVMT
ncbi:MAG: M20 family metallo-hydrolase, partial [Candidatus Rokuibacteriota bacterium]